MIELTHLIEAKTYKGQLFPKQASELIEAALNTAKELLSTAEILYNCKRFAHCVSMSILAMEETGKISIIMAMLTGFSELNEGWKQYTRHLSKTEHIDYAIVMQIRNYFSNFSKCLTRKGLSDFSGL